MPPNTILSKNLLTLKINVLTKNITHHDSNCIMYSMNYYYEKYDQGRKGDYEIRATISIVTNTLYGYPRFFNMEIDKI